MADDPGQGPVSSTANPFLFEAVPGPFDEREARPALEQVDCGCGYCFCGGGGCNCAIAIA
jgi:hypothetical protein